MQKTKYTIDKIESYTNDYDAHNHFKNDLILDLSKTTDKKSFLDELIKNINNNKNICDEIKNVTIEIINTILPTYN